MLGNVQETLILTAFPRYATGLTLTEAQNINRSLLELGNVISALMQMASHVPYRCVLHATSRRRSHLCEVAVHRTHSTCEHPREQQLQQRRGCGLLVRPAHLLVVLGVIAIAKDLTDSPICITAQELEADDAAARLAGR